MRIRLTSFCLVSMLPYVPRGSGQRVRRYLRLAIYLTVAATALAVDTLSIAHAQDIEPRAYSNAPIGMNFLIAGYAYTKGALPFDASLPVKNAQLKTSSAVLAYARVLDLWGKSAKFDAIVPVHLALRIGRARGPTDSSATSTVSPIPGSDCRSTCTVRRR